MAKTNGMLFAKMAKWAWPVGRIVCVIVVFMGRYN